MICPLFIKLALDGFEQLSIQDRRLLAGKDFTLEGDFADSDC
jgi:hypothetical protein